MSGWILTGAVQWTLPAGTVIDANDTLTIVFDRKAYIATHTAELTDQVIVGNATTASATALTLTDGTGEVLCSVSWAEPPYPTPTDPAGAAALETVIARRPAITTWLTALPTEDKEALKAFAGSDADLETCWLVDIPPQENPEVALDVKALALTPEGTLTLDVALEINGADKAGSVNGEVILRTRETLDGDATEVPVTERTFPLNLQPSANASARFFQVIIR